MRVDARDPGPQPREAVAERLVLDEDRVEALVVAARAARRRRTSGTGTRSRRRRRTRRRDSRGRRAGSRTASTDARMLAPSSAMRAASGCGFSSSAAIRFGGRFQTLLNQSTKTCTSARRARLARVERRLGNAALEPVDDRRRVARRPRRRRRAPARAAGRSPPRPASGRAGRRRPSRSRRPCGRRRARRARRSSRTGSGRRAGRSEKLALEPVLASEPDELERPW